MIRIEDIEFAIDMVTHSNVIMIEVFLNTKTKELIYPDEDGEFDSNVELGDEDLLPIPTRRELGLGKPLALQFAQEYMSDQYDAVRDIFSSSGAYSKFKGLLSTQDQIDQWYEYEQSKTHQAIRDWLEAEDISLEL